MVQTMAARAAVTPVRSAADWPQGRAWRTSRSQGNSARSAAIRSDVAAVEPSVTKIASKAPSGAQAAAI